MQKKLSFIVCCLTVSLVVTGISLAQKPLAIRGGKIITMSGEPIENGTIVFRDGKIVAVGTDIKIPVEAKVIDATGKVVMPGFVESHSSSGMSQANETNPIVPYVSVIDSIDPMNNYFRQARRNGVTAVRITPGNSTMIGGQAVVVKTGGEFLDDMVLKPNGGIKISMRPVSGSRMGHLAKLRKALGDSKKKMLDKKKDKTKNKTKDKTKDDDKDSKKDSAKEEKSKDAAEGKKTPSPIESDLDKAMFALLSGEYSAIIYCEKAMDVAQALRLIKEYDLKASLVLGRECYKAADQVAKSGLPVVLDPTLVYWEEDPRTKEETKIVLTEIFRKQKVPFVFQVDRARSATQGRNFLWYQAATAVKYGMPKQEALEALTILPAKFLGVDKFVGSIEKGKDADVVIMSGDPLRLGTWVETTIVDGKVVYQRDKDKQLQRLLTGEEIDTMGQK